MEFINRQQELHRLNAALRDAHQSKAALAVLWGRRRVGKSRLLTEWCRQVNGLYTVAEQSAAEIQRAYLATAIATRALRFGGAFSRWWETLGRRSQIVGALGI